MANYKTIKEILSQTNFNGADAGKLLLISYVNSKSSKNKPIVNKETLDSILSTLPSRQLKIFNAYSLLQANLEKLEPQITGYKQQFYNCYNYLLGVIKDFNFYENDYLRYLNTPLLLNKKLLDELELVSFKDFCSQKITGFNLIKKYIYDLFDIYTASPEALTDKEQAVFKLYGETPINIEVAIDNYIAGADCKNEAVLQHLVDIFSYIYGTEKEIEKVIEFILNECKLNSELLGIKKLASKKNKNADDYIKIIELYDLYKQAENSFYNKPIVSVFDPDLLIKSLPRITVEGVKLTELLTFRDKTFTSKTYKDFIDTFPELYNFVKTDLIERLPLLDKPDSELFNTELSYIQLIEANILDFNIEDSTEYKLQRDYILSKEATSPSQYLIQRKAQAGIGLAITPPSKEETELFLNYGDNYKITPDTIEPETIESYKTNGLNDALGKIFAYNRLLEVYSDLFKVDLTSLKLDVNFDKYASSFNTQLYRLYFSLAGDKNTLKKKQENIRKLLKPFIKEEYTPNEKQVKDYVLLLKEQAKKDLLLTATAEFMLPFLNKTFREGFISE